MKSISLLTLLFLIFIIHFETYSESFNYINRFANQFECRVNDNSKEIPIEFKFDNCFIDSFLIIECNFKYGIINHNGDTVLPIEYYEIKLLKGGKAFVKKSYFWEYVDLMTCHFEPLEYNYIGNISERTNWVAPFYRDTIVGILDTNLNEIQIQNCIELSEFKEGFAIYKTGFGDGIIDQYGNKKTKPIYNFIKIIDQEKAFFIRDQFYGFLDMSGIEISQFQTLEPFLELSQSYFDSKYYYFVLSNDSTLISNGVLMQINNLYEYIYKDFKINFLDSNEKIYNVTNDYFFVDGENYSTVFDRNGQLILSIENVSIMPIYDVSFDIDHNQSIPTRNPFNENLFIISTNNSKFGLWNENVMVLDTIYDDIYYFDSNLFIVKINEKKGLCDSYGNFIIQPTFDLENNQREFLFKIIDLQNKNKVGFINVKGEMLIPPIYDDGLEFHDNIGALKLNQKWGFVNYSGEFIISFLYDSVRPFETDRSIVKQNGLWGIINKKGEIIIQTEYDRIEQFCPGLFMIYKNNYLYFADYNGKIISDKISDNNSINRSKIFKGSWYFHDAKIKIFKQGKTFRILML